MADQDSKYDQKNVLFCLSQSCQYTFFRLKDLCSWQQEKKEYRLQIFKKSSSIFLQKKIVPPSCLEDCYSSFKKLHELFLITKITNPSKNKTVEMTCTLEPDIAEIVSERPYECPCKKTYKSYPALFTHIKNKHNGTPPGSIKKPSPTNKKLGRPPANFSKSSIQTQYFHFKSQDQNQFFATQIAFQELLTTSPEHCVNRIASILSSLPAQNICREGLNEITAMMEMTVFMATKKEKEPKKSIGSVIEQLLGVITDKVEWMKFKYFFTLLMVFSQYIIKKIKNHHLFSEEQPDLLCSFINQFVQFQVEKMTLQYKIQALFIFQRKYMLQLFYWFFEWMLQKQYTTYKVTFKDNSDVYIN